MITRKTMNAGLTPPLNNLDGEWKIHTANLLDEIVNCSGQAILAKPINILGKLLALVGERAAEINDPRLNALMCRLTIYTIADPLSADYDPVAVRTVMDAAKGKS